MRSQQVTSGGVHDTFWLSRRPRGVKDKQRIFRVHRLGRTVGRGLGRLDGVVDVATFDHRHVGAGAADHQDLVDLHLLEGRINIGLQRHDLAAAHALVGGDDDGRIAIDQASLLILKQSFILCQQNKYLFLGLVII